MEGALNLAIGPVPYHRVKRLIDLVGSAVLLIALVPLFSLVGLLVAVNVGFAHAYGADGQRKSDSVRVSAVGDFLRRTHLDELPQLLNILKGDMSFVGPRPLLPIDQPTDSRSRLLVRPGLTGWAQIKGGGKISPDDKAALDMWYVRNMSLSIDLKILLGTVPMLAFGERIEQIAIIHARQDACPADSIAA